jgi:hypothetical protein
MEKFAVIKCVNGNFSVHAEGFTDLSKAKVSYHGLCQMLWNADDVITASVIIVNENFYEVTGFHEVIEKPVVEETNEVT